MTAEQEHSLNYTLLNLQNRIENIDKEVLHWSQVEVIGEEMLQGAASKKRRRQLGEEDHQNLTPPLEKSPRKNEDQVTEEEQVELQLIDDMKLKEKGILLAYKRIWNNLDLNKPADAKLEPFVWRKIREYQHNK